MSSTLTITDRLVQASTRQTLHDFIVDHVANGGDKFSLVASIALATGNAVTIDIRTSAAWIGKAQAGTLL